MIVLSDLIWTVKGRSDQLALNVSVCVISAGVSAVSQLAVVAEVFSNPALSNCAKML